MVEDCKMCRLNLELLPPRPSRKADNEETTITVTLLFIKTGGSFLLNIQNHPSFSMKKISSWAKFQKTILDIQHRIASK